MNENQWLQLAMLLMAATLVLPAAIAAAGKVRGVVDYAARGGGLVAQGGGLEIFGAG